MDDGDSWDVFALEPRRQPKYLSAYSSRAEALQGGRALSWEAIREFLPALSIAHRGTAQEGGMSNETINGVVSVVITLYLKPLYEAMLG